MRALFRRPSLAAAATVLLICLPAGRQDLSSGVQVTAADVASLVLVAIAVTVALANRLTRPLSARDPAPAGAALPARAVAAASAVVPARALVLAPVAGAAGIAMLASPDVLTSMPGYVRYLQVFVLVPLAVLVAVRDRTDTLIVGGALVGTAALQGLIGCVQAVTGTGASYAGERVRAVGTFGALDIMGMASVVSYGVLVLLAAGLAWRGGRRAAALGGAALLCVPLALSLSRGAWLALLGASLVVLFVHSRALLARVILLGAAAATVLVLGPGAGSDPDMLGRRLASITSVVSHPDQSVSDRYSLWLTATRIWLDHPLTGAGPRRFAELRDAYAPIELSSGSDTDDPVNGFQRMPLLSPHNMYLLTLSEQGLLGLAALGACLGSMAWWAVRAAVPAAAGLLAWQGIDFLYGDVGGPSTVVMSVVLGLVLSLVARPPATGWAGEAPVALGVAR
ncbi:O-antigen ligase family protein [Nonomuraea sp. NPDC004186]